ncbi:hypothetical protein [Posidoniimonas corsicana]|nr:hypothetical protein [Posidoniimonas corsicana]
MIVGLFSPQAGAEVRMQFTGKFTGYYHENRWGVGHFRGDRVAAPLREQFAPYEGKRIEVDIKRSGRFSSDGPAMIEAVGEITELPPQQLRIELEAWPDPDAKVPHNQQRLLIKLLNQGEHPVEVSLRQLSLKQWRLPHQTKIEREAAPLSHGYTRQQLMARSSGHQYWGPGQGNSPISHLSSHGVVPSGLQIWIGPGEAFPILPPPAPLAKDAEIEVVLVEGTDITSRAWFATDQLKAPVELKESKLFCKDVVVSKEFGGRHCIRFAIHSKGALARHVVATPLDARSPDDENSFELAGKLYATHRDEKSSGVYLNSWANNGMPASLVSVPSDGVRTKFVVRTPLCERYRFEVLTESGLETVWIDLPGETAPAR